MSTDFKNTGRLLRDGDPITEWETNSKDFPSHVGKLYVEGNWFTVEQARELRDFLNQVLPEDCGVCNGSGFYTRHLSSDTHGLMDADDQYCPECNEDGQRIKVAP